MENDVLFHASIVFFNFYAPSCFFLSAMSLGELLGRLFVNKSSISIR